ncbi:hypothetical protein ILYODFUR_035073 [Ilyodon furcidens]|uniref:Secreted protein n=1 Tax=Ilyodon furcidens TaxID=33524 RepID=A0ABV0T2R3_9TELE
MRWVHILVLVQIVVKVVERLVALVPVEVYGVGLWYVSGFKSAGHQRHELAEDADAAVPEGPLREPPGQGPGAVCWIVCLHYIRQLERVVVTAGYKQLPSEDCHAASDVNLKDSKPGQKNRSISKTN